ncbi:MAG: hydrogenase maturation nickel metallochaperone HypA [Candidatus Marinimicrobia bacterium]|nr:hydrogenase maturation nickel metallochaperone HypA [Candidatus Neomarinimicrobiota bacterium]MBL7031249.1 hydrogenase maturation nickel metallochaperone HypA [Candidatus Neomarinimicrobiota bacterium]
MHELTLLNDLLKKVREIAVQEKAKKVKSVSIWLGAMSHISASHFKEHFDLATKDSDLEGVPLNIETSDDAFHPQAQDILLRSVDVESQ